MNHSCKKPELRRNICHLDFTQQPLVQPKPHVCDQESPLQITFAGAAIGNGWINPYHKDAATETAIVHGTIDYSNKGEIDRYNR